MSSHPVDARQMQTCLSSLKIQVGGLAAERDDAQRQLATVREELAEARHEIHRLTEKLASEHWQRLR